ncbi:MAG TPA: anti-sigma F factor antagonist [Candidatus Pseudogracilibacillus intestinigallinarum]|uniref:Anti-sigma F factor antagonist n=1 Tax=Candidatus Pseudogracilibacillus intestinigallinarum TaxID=2838742 RepID=A0A9D1PLB7_9BACI|nr:anti-sigma F factor antagonist [Candidatus Pseudogracilibacillus intestinigallinarum]
MALQSYFVQMDDVLIIRLDGELDHHATKELKRRWQEAIEREDIQHIVLNLEHLTFMDSSGIGIILGRYKEIEAKNGEIVICAVHPSVERLLTMAGIFKIIRKEASEETALLCLGGV